MAERLVRLYGPASVSNSLAAPTNLFTVPTVGGKIYVLRLMQTVTSPNSGGAANVSMLLGKTSLAPANLVGALGFSTGGGVYTTDAQPLTTPMQPGESLVGAYASSAGDPAAETYSNADSVGWHLSTSSDASSIGTGSFVPQTTLLPPTNVFFCVVSTKASSADLVTSIVDSHSPAAVRNIASIVSAVSGTTTSVRSSIWAGYLASLPTDSNGYTVTFGGTFTGVFVEGVAISNVAYTPGEPSSGTFLQTVSATGTTETTQTMPMTPLQSDSCTLMVVGTNGAASTYTGPSNSTELSDGSFSTPSATAAMYLISPSVSNPAPVIASAGSNWAAAAVEIARGGASNLTLSGIVIE